MGPRVVALLVALVLLLSGWTSQTRSAALAPVGAEQALDPAQHAAGGDSGDTVAADQPGTGDASAEGAGDLPALVTAGLEFRPPRLSMAPPRPYAMAALVSPDLDGPQRPPRATTRIA